MSAKNKKVVSKAFSLIIAISMVLGMIMPLIRIEASAAAPTSYTDISADSTATVNITTAGSSKYFRFVPTYSGTYKFYSTNNTADPYVALLNASGSQLRSDDDSGDGNNFSITYACSAGETYYIKAYMYSSSRTGSYTLNVQTMSIDCIHDYVLQSSTVADCVNDGSETYVCLICGNSYTNPITALGHNYSSGVCTRCGIEEPSYVAISEYNSSTGDVFLGGRYIELGISRHGSFGTSTRPTNSGFHSNGSLGMIVDGDGWDYGDDPTTGDFFLPDTPEERYVFSYYYNGNKYDYVVAERNGVYSGTWNTEPTVRNESHGNELRAVVRGVTQHNVVLEIIYSFDVDDKNYKTTVNVTNESGYDITNVRFVRSFDPDQDDDIYNTNNTYNKILANPDRTRPAGEYNYAMVVARGSRTLDGFFFVAFDNRAYVTYGSVALFPTSAYVTGLWEETHSFPNFASYDSIYMEHGATNGYSQDDTCIAITFNLSTISANGRNSLEYYSSMSPSVEEDIEELLPVAPTINSVSGAQVLHNGSGVGPSIDAVVAADHVISYQWYINSVCSNDGGTAIPGATSATYAVPNTYPAGTVEYYYCVVTATRTDNGLYTEIKSAPIVVEYFGTDHTFEETSRTEATCTTDGAITYTCSCGDTTIEIISALGHDFVIGTCTRCGELDITPSADVWDGTVDTSWYNSTATEFTIYTAEQLAGLAQLVNSGNTFRGKTIYLGNDIDLANREWTPIGKGTQQNSECNVESLYFSGTFDGNYHTVSNISITQNSTSFNGLFGALKNAAVECLAIDNVYINQVTPYRTKCGAIAGVAENSTISFCSANNVVLRGYATNYPASFGGLLGIALGYVEIESCFATVDIVGGGHCGGLAGGVYYSGRVSMDNCYAIGNIVETDEGSVNTSNVAAGLIAFKSGNATISISNSFFSGTVTGSTEVYLYAESAVVSNCYHSDSTDDANFQSQSWIESNLGWDFDTVWEFRPGSDYPVLKGFDILEPSTCTHNESDVIVDTEATCVAEGSGHTECTLCGTTMQTVVIPATGNHDFYIQAELDATCTRDGYVVYACRNCTLSTTHIIYADGHDFGGDHICDECGYEVEYHTHDYVVTVVAPTCTTVGYTVYACGCGHSYRVDYIDQTGHRWNSGEVTIAKTCNTDGLMTFTCTSCNETYTRVIPAGHEWSEITTTEKTCTTDGLISKTCDVCGETEEVIIPAGHTWNAGEEITPATCETTGVKLVTCEVCGTTENHEIPVLGHRFENGVCTLCGAGIEDVVTPDEEHPEYGMYFEIDDIRSNYGDDIINEYGVLLDYNQGANIRKVGVFLTQDGTMWRRCIACVGDGITYATYVPYLSYDEDIKYTGLNSPYINIFRLKENADGIWCYSNYTTIGVNLEDEYGRLLLSLYDIGQAGTKTRIFDDLQEMIDWLKEPDITHTHTESDWIVDVEPTCCANGRRYTVCTECGDEMNSEVIPATGNHTESDWIIDLEPTCTVEGSKHKECTLSGLVLVIERIPPTGVHTEGDWIIDIAPTCVDEGSRHTVCTVCGNTVQTEVIPPTGVHTEGGWIIDVNPTITSQGEKHKECTVCHAIIHVERIPALAKIKIEDVSVRRGALVNVTIDIQNNPGILGAVLTIDFDSRLELVSVTTGAAWSSLDFTEPASYVPSSNFVWDGITVPDANNGTIITLTFQLPTDAEPGAEYIINASYDDGNIVDGECNPIDVYIESGKIVVLQDIRGDVNDDGVIDVADVIMLRRYMAGGYNVNINLEQSDVNYDGIITILDIIRLREYILGIS